ncbi:MAG: hypothetical protein ACNA7W_00400 [Pseudomonadales bacterium]
MDYQDVVLELAVEFPFGGDEADDWEDWEEAESAAPADPQTFYLALKAALDHIQDQLQQVEA